MARKPRTFKEKFNAKHGQPLNQSNSITKIAKLSGISYRRSCVFYESAIREKKCIFPPAMGI